MNTIEKRSQKEILATVAKWSFTMLFRSFNQGRTFSWINIPGKTCYSPSKSSCTFVFLIQTLSEFRDCKSYFSAGHLELREARVKERDEACGDQRFEYLPGGSGSVSENCASFLWKGSSSVSHSLWCRHCWKSTWKTEWKPRLCCSGSPEKVPGDSITHPLKGCFPKANKGKN